MGMCAYFVALNQNDLALLEDEPEQAFGMAFPENPAEVTHNVIDIDKAWHAIHFLLNGASVPQPDDQAPAIFGGEPIGDQMDYGPARVLQPDEVKALALTLSAIDNAALRARFSPGQLAEEDIYPGVWDDPEADLDYVLLNYQRMSSFYAAAAERGHGMLLFLA